VKRIRAKETSRRYNIAADGLEFTWLHISWNGEEAKLTKMILEFISRECRRDLHEECHFRWEGFGFEIICASAIL
jgi:hypothetical protein